MAHNNPVPLIPSSSLLEKAEEEDLRGNLLTHVHLKKTVLNEVVAYVVSLQSSVYM